MRGKSTGPRKPKEMNIFNMKVDQFRMNAEEKFIFQKMRELFKQLRGLPDEERKDSLLTLSLIMNSIFKTNEETKMIPQIEKTLQELRNKKVEFEGFVNSARYDLYKEIALYDFKINNEKIPFLLSSQLLIAPCFDIYNAQNNREMEIILIEDELGLQKLYLVGKGTLRYKKGEELVVDISRHYELSLV
ncbi:MAG: hypothetical protein AMJ42_05155 [Deltaproteobacteria bacterium DG_8]|nr:MAG: hypothetical protein AMJ42_05155 [Deltaproteobacteria bacterium DG_8]